MNVLVTDGENRSSLAATRSLGRNGCNVFVSGKQSGNISASSRFCRKALTTPDPLDDGANYCEAIIEIVRRERIDVIFPMTDQSIYRLNTIRERLEGCILACAPAEKMEAVSNKYTLFQLAEKMGIAIPNTIYVTSISDFMRKRAGITQFPVVVKPALSKKDDGEKLISAGVMYAASAEELNRLYEMTPVLRFPSLIQEMIVGEGTGLFTLFDRDRPLVLFSHRRLLEKPPSGGVSVLSESVSLDQDMVEAASRLLSAVGWTGIAMVEFKRDVRDGQAKLMEINGRFWGSLQLAISSGVDFPSLCLDYYLGKNQDEVLSEYTVGHRLKWFFGVLDHLIIRLKNKNSLNLPFDFPTLWHLLGELIKTSDSHTSSDVYDLQDLKPYISEVRDYVRNCLK